MKIIACREKNRKDPFILLTVLQTVGAAVIIAVVILAAKHSPDVFLSMREQFGVLTEDDYDIEGLVRKAADEVVAGIHNETTTEKTGGESVTEQTAAVMSGRTEKIIEKETTENTEEYEDVPAMPVNGIVSSEYGTRIHPIYNTESFHSGRDIAADEGTDIHAALDGDVIAVGVGQSSGNYIKLKHSGGYETLYCHCSEIYAREGDKISKGEVIAAVGHTGLATGPHLHFEVHKNGQLADPSVLLDKACDEY